LTRRTIVMTAPYVPGPAGQPPYVPAPAATGAGRSFWTRGPGVMLITVLVGLALIAVLGLTGFLSGSNSVKVKVTACDIDYLAAGVDLEVTNTGNRRVTATIALEYRDGQGRRVDTDSKVVRDIAAGDTVRTSETTWLDVDPKGGTCHARVDSIS
jgi:hypothetical protein